MVRGYLKQTAEEAYISLAQPCEDLVPLLLCIFELACTDNGFEATWKRLLHTVFRVQGNKVDTREVTLSPFPALVGGVLSRLNC